MESIDWDAGLLELRYRYRFGPYHYLRLWYTQGVRHYEEEPAGLVDGTELEENPAEEHIYRGLTAAYLRPVGSRIDIELSYGYRSKEDTFEGY